MEGLSSKNSMVILTVVFTKGPFVFPKRAWRGMIVERPCGVRGINGYDHWVGVLASVEALTRFKAQGLFGK